MLYKLQNKKLREGSLVLPRQVNDILDEMKDRWIHLVDLFGLWNTYCSCCYQASVNSCCCCRAHFRFLVLGFHKTCGWCHTTTTYIDPGSNSHRINSFPRSPWSISISLVFVFLSLSDTVGGGDHGQLYSALLHVDNCSLYP